MDVGLVGLHHLTASLGVQDWEAKPPPESCPECGGEVPWSWWEPPDHLGLDPRWMRPQGSCQPCTTTAAAAEKEAKTLASLRLAGVPKRYRSHRWERFAKQGRDEGIGEFRRRILEAQEPTVGITRSNAEAARLFRGWRPVDEAGRPRPWVYLHGGCGTGKTLFASMLSRTLVGDPLRFVPVTDPDHLPPRYRQRIARGQSPPLRRVGGYQVRFVQEHALQSGLRSYQERLRYDRKAKSPLAEAEAAQVLVLDDIGTAEQSPRWKRTIESLIDSRYAAGRPMVMTGNLAFEDLERHYGSARLVSRLEEAVGGTAVALDLTDWRQLGSRR